MLIVVGGPMFAGKTTWLLDFVKELPSESYMFFKPNIDTRYAKNKVVSHDGRYIRSHNLDSKNPRLPKIGSYIKTILIDELNFFNSKKIMNLISQYRENMDITIITAGLFYDILKKPFGATLELSKIADKVVRLNAVCDKCKKDAIHTYRKIKSDKQIIIGSKDIYGACCETCWDYL